MDDTLAIIGAGSIGGAIAKGLMKSGYKGRIIATRRSIEKLKELETLGVEVTNDNRKAAREADIVFLC
ncbi:MAG: NAD(P)-binding domain-containing protein, partial [Candidatus Bathyarchaeia archaeon]